MNSQKSELPLEVKENQLLESWWRQQRKKNDLFAFIEKELCHMLQNI